MLDGDSPPPRRRLTRAEAKAQTRARLLEAAARVFAERGFDGASVEEIAEAAGYSTGALYANFANKQQLFLELVVARRSRAAARRVEAVAGLLEEEARGGRDLFDAFSRLFVEVADRDREFAPLQAEFWLYAVRHPDAMDVIAAAAREQIEGLEPVVVRALERFGASASIEPREATVVVFALFQGLLRQRRLDPAAVADDLFGQALRWVFAGLQPEAQGKTGGG